MHLLLSLWVFRAKSPLGVRDGAHGHVQAGIYGERDKGAYSIIVSGGYGYHDEDHGNVILYCGTEGNEYQPTEATQRLIESCDSIKNPVRVIRSWTLPRNNRWRPARGFRYDGLYRVVAYEFLNEAKAHMRFKLVRCPGQQEIRFEGKKARPTQFEIDAYDQIRVSQAKKSRLTKD